MTPQDLAVAALLERLATERNALLRQLAPLLKEVSSAATDRAKATRKRRRQRNEIRAKLKENASDIVSIVIDYFSKEQ